MSLADLNEGWIDDAADDGSVVYSVDDAYPQVVLLRNWARKPFQYSY